MLKREITTKNKIMKRVAYVSTCGAGHFNTIRSIWSRDHSVGSRLFLVRFSDEVLPLLDEKDDVVILTCNERRPSENATIFNGVRAAALQDALHVWLHDYRPTLIVYDFFCLEARAVAYLLGVPAICSIPATLKSDEKETCSDAVLPKEHFYWIWRNPYEVSIEPVAFLGPRMGNISKPRYQGFANFYKYLGCTLVTFGTVVPHYDGCKTRLTRIMEQLEQLILQDKDNFYIFAGIQGPPLDNCDSYYGPNTCDLKDFFQYAPINRLIFHGGGNTYAEALAARVPKILVCPFFGDQFETARQEGNQYSGNLLQDVARIKEHVYPEDAPLLGIPFTDSFPDYFKRGDLVFGHRRHRAALQKAFPQVNLHLEHYKPFATFANPGAGDLPSIADVYNDEISLLTNDIVDPSSSLYHARLSELVANRSRAERTMIHLPTDHRLVFHCLDILERTIEKWGGRIHFVLGPLNELGSATKIELDYIEEHWTQLCDSILFYDLQGKRIPVPWSCPLKLKPTTSCKSLEFDEFVKPLLQIPGRMPIIWGRVKSQVSRNEKSDNRHLPLLDIFGWRTGYLNQEDLARLQEAVLPSWNVSVNWCRQKVWYYYYKNSVELQIWPWTFLHCFYLNEAGVETNRERQFEMQQLIEGAPLK